MATLTGFPLVSQRTQITSDGRVSEDALYECVAASIGACMLWLQGNQQWDVSLNPDLLKDRAYGEAYTGGTSAAQYVDVVKSMGFHLAMQEKPDPVQTVALARQLLAQNKPVIMTILDPWVDTSLPQYAGWTHVCVFIGDDGAGLTAMDPFIAQAVYKSYSTWARLLRANQVWTVEKIPMSTVPAGWTDDGHTLKSPNGVPVVLGFRDYVLAHNWDKDNWALTPEGGMAKLEASNPSLGGGDQQMFRMSMLGYTPARGVFEEWLGVELDYTRKQYTALWNAYQKLLAAPQVTQQPAQLSPDMQQVVAVANKYIIPATP
jgi:hypothetical protein